MFISKIKHVKIVSELNDQIKCLEKIIDGNNKAKDFIEVYKITPEVIEDNKIVVYISNFDDSLIIKKKHDEELYGLFYVYLDGTIGYSFKGPQTTWLSKENLAECLSKYYYKIKR